MPRPLSFLVPALVLWGLLAPVPAQAAEGASYVREPLILIDHGVICHVGKSGSRPAPDTMLGEINLIDETRGMDVTTRLVPALEGISFGVKFALSPGNTTRDVTMVVTHPPMGEQGITRESWVSALSDGRPSLGLFSFEFDFEMVPGPWVMAVEQDGRRLLEQHFEVVPELAAPDVVSACLGGEFLS